MPRTNTIDEVVATAHKSEDFHRFKSPIGRPVRVRFPSLAEATETAPVFSGMRGSWSTVAAVDGDDVVVTLDATVTTRKTGVCHSFKLTGTRAGKVVELCHGLYETHKDSPPAVEASA